ncbi:MAG: TonB family protein [Gammaproteobacteria bacterium]
MASLGTTELLILSADPAVRDAVEASLRDAGPVHIADDAVSALDLAARHPVGVVVVDLDNAGNDIESLIDTLKELAPGMITILAGEHDALAELTHLNVDGTVYRFLIKPVSGGQLRMAVESAMQKCAGGVSDTEDAASPAGWWASGPLMYAGFAALALVAGSAAWMLTAPSTPHSSPRPAASVVSPVVSGETTLPAETGESTGGAYSNRFGVLLARAEQAIQEQRYVGEEGGEGDDAVSLYGRILAEDPDNPAAIKGLEKIMRVFVADTREALEMGDIDGAEMAFDVASQVLPNDPRLATLEQQLVDARVVELVAEAKAELASGDLDQAAETLSRVESLDNADPETVEDARQAIEDRFRAEQAARYLSLGKKRLERGRLVEPGDDSALTYLRAARNDGADADATAEFERQLGEAMLARARGALDQKSTTAAREWLGHAQALEADIEGLDELEVAVVRRETIDAEHDRLLALASARLDSGQLITPDGDSARDYLRAAQGLAPQDPRAAGELARVADRLMEQALTALASDDYAEAEELLAEARATGARGEAPDRLEQRIRLAMAPPPPPEPKPDPVPVRRKYVPPEYPRDALLRGLEGTVAVAFTVMPDGEPDDISVVTAKPRNTFDRAAMNAVRQWQFDPVMIDGEPVPHPMQVEIEFVLNE